MVAVAGELLFEASTGTRWTRDTLKALAHHLGRLYGETIRTCKGQDGLRQEVVNTFMCGMALEPNFGREEEKPAEHYCGDCDNIPCQRPKLHNLPEKTPGMVFFEKEIAKIEGYQGTTWAALSMRDREGYEALAAAKTPGQLLFEKECGSSARSWDKLPLSCRIAYENKARDRAAMEKILDAPVGTPLPPDSPFATIDWDKDEEVQAKAEADKPKAVCFKCKNTGNMGFSTYMRCDACE